jgi:YHS domain-containing protein
MAEQKNRADSQSDPGSGGNSGKSGAATKTKVRDVVCGKNIDPESAMFTSNYKGTTYYFCSEGCKQKFDADPETYA